MKAPRSRSSLRIALHELRTHRLALVLVIALSIVAGVAETGVLVVLVAAAQGIAAGHSEVTSDVGPLSVSMGVGSLAIIGAALVCAFFLANLIVVVLRVRVSIRWEQARRAEVTQAFLDADHPTQTAERSGRLQVVANDWVGAASGVATQLVQLARASFSLVVFIAASLLTDVRVTVAMAVFGGVMALLMLTFRRRVRTYSGQAAAHQAVLASEIAEVEAMAREIRLYRAEGARAAHLASVSGVLTQARARASRWGGIATPLYQATGLLVLLLSLAVAATLDGVSVAGLGASALLLFRSISYGQLAQTALQSLDQLAPYFERIDDVVAELRRHAVNRDGDELRQVGTIEVTDLSYRYGPDEPWALRGVSFDVAENDVVGVVGPSGSGKSTLAQILLRLREPTAGAYLIDGAPASSYALDSWARDVALVSQDTKILAASLLDNVLFDRDWLGPEDAARALTQAGLDTLVEELPDGAMTQIGPGARQLSGGQAQRVGIARALAARPRFVVLDEPTSALDHGSEAIVQDTIRSLRGELTLVIIAHRLSTLDVCDRVVRLERGRVAEIGPTQAVLAGMVAHHEQLDLR